MQGVDQKHLYIISFFALILVISGISILSESPNTFLQVILVGCAIGLFIAYSVADVFIPWRTERARRSRYTNNIGVIYGNDGTAHLIFNQPPVPDLDIVTLRQGEFPGAVVVGHDALAERLETEQEKEMSKQLPQIEKKPVNRWDEIEP